MSPRRRAAVLAAVKKLNFVPHSGARSLTRRKTDTVGVILPDLFGEFFSEIIRGIDLVAHESGMHLLLGNMHGSTHETAAAIAAMRGRVDGLLVMPPDVKPELLSGYLDPALPTVLLNYDAGTLDLPFVAVDNYRGAYTMTEALLERAARGRWSISPARSITATRAIASAASSMRWQRSPRFRSPAILPGDFSEESGAEAGRLLVQGQLPADAVFAANDQMAVGLIAQLADAGMSVPGDVMVAGFDDIPLARHLNPSLTTMQVKIDRLGSTAMMMLLRILRGETLGSGERDDSDPDAGRAGDHRWHGNAGEQSPSREALPMMRRGAAMPVQLTRRHLTGALAALPLASDARRVRRAR
jgi:LacI family transcriptional regulator